MSNLTNDILHLHGWVALLVIFALPALESSAFLGFVFPGEIAVLLGGVLAFQHRVSLPGALAAAVLGAVVGDTVGYEVGKHIGRRLLNGTIGRFVKAEHIDRAERYLAERGGKAVFLGRFTAALRVMIPGLAGMSGMRYSTFATYNVSGGVIWATTFVLLGYAGGSSYRHIEAVAKSASLILLAVVIVVGGTVLLARRIARNPDRIRRFGARQANRPWVASLRARYRRQLDFLLRRVRPEGTLGLSLTVSLVLISAVGWAFGAVTQNVLTKQSLDPFDRPVVTFFFGHREPWLTTTAKIAGTVGTWPVLVPLVLAVGLIILARAQAWRPLALLAVAYGGGEGLTHLVAALVNRPRPPSTLAAAPFSGPAFPSESAVVGVAVWGMLAALAAVSANRWSLKVAAWTGAGLAAGLAGATRLYLGTHWLTDVVGGWALGALWLFALLMAVRTVAALREGRPRAGRAGPADLAPAARG